MRYSHDTVYVRDLGSKYGTYLNGDRIKSESFVKVKRGDIVSFGEDEYILIS
jgi:pSer/pThr/pTyr-binding forkhead associated (FHA) protein